MEGLAGREDSSAVSGLDRLNHIERWEGEEWGETLIMLSWQGHVSCLDVLLVSLNPLT